MLNLGFTIPILLDKMRDEIDDKYAALPERFYVLDKDGRVYYRSVIGPAGFDVDAWLEAIKKQIDRVYTATAE